MQWMIEIIQIISLLKIKVYFEKNILRKGEKR